jgi:hypothetical protein
MMWEKKNALYITTAKVSRKGAGAIPKVGMCTQHANFTQLQVCPKGTTGPAPYGRPGTAASCEPCAAGSYAAYECSKVLSILTIHKVNALGH